MATLEELVVSLVAETSGLRAELDKATKATVGATDKMDKAIEEFSKNSSANVGVFQTAMGTAIGFLGSQAVLGAFGALKDAAGFLFQELIVNGVSAASETETAINKMNQALALSGQYSKGASDRMIELASSLQETTRFGDDAVLSASALIQTIGRLGANELPGATRAAVDLAAALSIDLDSAAKLVGKAAAGNVDAFSRYGIVIEKGTTVTETFANAMNTLSRFQGTAAAQAKTFAGLTDILNHSWEDFTKVTGNAVIQNQALLNVMAEVNQIVTGSTKELESNSQAMKELVANALILFIDTAGVAVQTLDLFVRSVQFLTGVALALTSPLFLVVAGLEALTNGLDAGKAVMDDWAKSMIEDLNAFGESGNGVLHGMTESFAGLSVAGQAGLDAIKAGAEATVEPTNNAAAAVAALTEAEQARIDKLKQFAEGLAGQTTGIEESYGYQLELLQNAREAEALTDEEFFAAKMEVLTAQQEAELALLEQYHKLKGSNDKTYADAKTALQKKQTLENAKFQKEQLDYEKMTAKERLALTSQTLNHIASLQSSGNRTLAAIGKAAAIADATIKGHQAVQSAYAWGTGVGGPAIGASFAALAGAATAVNIAKIAGVALNKGGTVPGSMVGPNRDSVPAMLTPGEEVINRDTANRLRSFLDNQDGGAMRIEITLKDELVEFVEAKIIERQRTGRSLLQGAM